MLFADRPTKPSNAAAVRLAQRCRGGSCGPSPGGIPIAQAGRRERVADARLRRAVALRKWDATEPRLDRVERLSALWEPISRPELRSRPSSWWRFEAEAEAPWMRRAWVDSCVRSIHCKGARSTAWRIVLRPQRHYQALRLRRTAARLRGLTAALRSSVGHPCRSTAQWIARSWLDRAWDLAGISCTGRRDHLSHRFDLHVAMSDRAAKFRFRATDRAVGAGPRHCRRRGRMGLHRPRF